MARPRLNKPLSYCRTEIRGMSPHLNDGLELLGMITNRTKAEVIEDAVRVYVRHLLDQGVIRDHTVATIINEEKLKQPTRINSHAARA